jgi:hypothetical protein
LKDGYFCVQEAEEVIEDDNMEGVVAPVEDLVLLDGLLATDAEEASAGEILSVRAEVPSGSTEIRGLGTEAFPGRADGRNVRRRNGATRPPDISHELWRVSAVKQKRDAVWGFEAASLTAAPAAMAARHSSGVPSLPPHVGEVDDQAHRNTYVDLLSIYPFCITRKVGRAELASNPRAQQALDKYWEALRSLPAPFSDEGTWSVGLNQRT